MELTEEKLEEIEDDICAESWEEKYGMLIWKLKQAIKKEEDEK